MKNPEHESGYFEDGSDVEIVFEDNIVGDEKKYGSGSYGLSKAIRQLDVTDSPASPEPTTMKKIDDEGRVQRNHIHSLLIITYYSNIYLLVKEKCDVSKKSIYNPMILCIIY